MKRNFIIFAFLIVVSCGNDDKKHFDQYIANFHDVIGKKVALSTPKLFNINKNYREVKKTGATILLMVGTDCNSCIEKFKAWQQFLDKGNFRKANVAFVAIGKDNEYFEYHVNKHNKFSFQILIDTSATFVTKHDLGPYISETMLLDKNSTIAMIGDPIGHAAIKNFYDYEIDKIVP